MELVEAQTRRINRVNKARMPPPFLKACTSETGDAGFAVSSSLPPMVTGTLAGEIELSVPYFDAKPGALRPTRYLHDRQYSDPLCAARIQWWGEGGPGTVLKPDLLGVRDEKRDRARRAALSDATCVLFPVRCELDGLVAYLKDMVSNTQLHNVTMFREVGGRTSRSTAFLYVCTTLYRGLLTASLMALEGGSETLAWGRGFLPCAYFAENAYLTPIVLQYS